VENVVAVVGCGPRLEVALRSALSRPAALVALAGPTPRSELIVAAVDLLLRGAGLTAGDLEGVAATRGPGSFTGVRVGLATAQGLARARDIPAHAYPSLVVQASRASEGEVLAVQPARRGFVYAQLFSTRGGRAAAEGEPRVAPLSSLADAEAPVAAPDGLALPPGTSAARLRLSTAEALLELFLAETSPDPSTLSPLYVEPPPAVPPSRTVAPWPPSPKAS
jgi:tRNA threonylcarbamoyl adenosine modification protein YeaZ